MTRTLRRRRIRRIVVVTGTRAEYGLLRPAMEAIDKHPTMRLHLVVTGMHLLKKFGRTVKDIRGDGWRIDSCVRMQRGDDSPLDQAEGLARGVRGIGRFLEAVDGDIVLVLGDRIEAMAGALAATATGRILGHIHGGDIAPGDLDDRFRHAISKLAHVHFAATKSAGRRLIRMGEEPRRVHVVGAPGLDRIRILLRQQQEKRSGTGRALVVYHAFGKSASTQRRTMSTILRAVVAAGLTPTIVYPNSDRGHSGVIEAIESHRDRYPRNSAEVVRSLTRDDYLRRLIDSDVIIGNSSSGVIEACFAGTPAVNVGVRQRGREKGGRAVIDADETRRSISSALQKALHLRPKPGAPGTYGTKAVGPKIAHILAKTPLDEVFRRKTIAY